MSAGDQEVTAQRMEVWARLAEAALVEGEMPPAPASGPPWFVRVMLGVAGWIGALFLLGFAGVLLGSLFDDAPLALGIGTILCAAAAFLLRWRGDNDFLAQFAFAVSLAGQGLLLAGFGELLDGRIAAIALTMAAVEAVLFFLVPTFLHRVWTAGTGALAVVVALADGHVVVLAPGLLTAACAWVWLRELEDSRNSEGWRAGGYGLTCTMILTVLLLDAFQDQLFHARWEKAEPLLLVSRPYLGAAVSTGALLYTILRLLAREGVPLGSGSARTALAGAGLLALASFFAPGLAPAVAIVVLGHANGNRVLTGLGIFALLGYLSYYYYSLETTLLIKSGLLVGVGSALLLVRLALHRWWPEPAAGEGGHA